MHRRRHIVPRRAWHRQNTEIAKEWPVIQAVDVRVEHAEPKATLSWRRFEIGAAAGK